MKFLSQFVKKNTVTWKVESKPASDQLVDIPAQD